MTGTRSSARSRAVAVAVALVAVLAASCTTGNGDRATDRPTETAGSPASASASGSPQSGSAAREGASPSTPTEPEKPSPPPEHGCYRLSFDALTEPSNDSDPVPCSAAGRHDAQTFHVGRLDTTVDGHSVAVDSDQVLDQLAHSCPHRLAQYLGGSPEDRRLSRFEAIWFVPTLEQSDLGASWFRCDVVALAGQDSLFPLPPPRRLHGILDRPGAGRFGLCGTAAPGESDFDRVICARPHSWRAVSTIVLGGSARYPGVRAVSAAGDETCSDRVRVHAADPLKFRYGWEWPTRDQWERGQHFGYCWAPD